MSNQPFSPHDWWDLPLVKQLDREDYVASIRLVFKHIEPLTGRTRPLGSEQCTDHDLVHSSRIIHRLGQILFQPSLLTQTELYLLLLAALLHDAGMWVPHEEALALLTEEAFLRWSEISMPKQVAHVREVLATKERRWLGELGLQQLAASWGRLKHPERIGSAVLAKGSPIGETLRHLIEAALLEPLATVCVAHSWERRVVVEHDDLRTRELGHGGDIVRLRLVAALLRLGDLLDLGEGRISTLLWDYLRPLPPLSEAHWRKEHTLRVELCRPDQIVLAGTFQPIAGTDASLEERQTVAEAYRLALEWISWLKAEISECTVVVESIVCPSVSSLKLFGAMVVDSKRVTAPYLAVDGPVSFHFDRQRILQLLGDEIYSSGAVFVRELLQNALDTTRAAMLRKHISLSTQDATKYPPDRPWDWPPEIRGSADWRIEAETGEEMIRDQRFITFLVRDRGLGMDLRQVRNHFLQVGLSYYRTPEFAKEFRFAPISRFGIGFLSCLMVSRRIEVCTRTASDRHGLRLSIQLPSDHYIVEKDQTLPQGTTVKLWIDPSATHRDNTAPPSINRDICKAIGIPETEFSDISPETIAQSVRKWIPFPEVSLEIDGQSWGPRKVQWTADAKNVLRGFTGARMVEVGVGVRSKSGTVLGRGCILIPAMASGVPAKSMSRLCDSADSFTVVKAHKSVWLNAEFNGEHAALLWHAYRLPPRSLSAGRTLRRSGTSDVPPENFYPQIQKNLLEYAFQRVEAQSSELASLWRYLVPADAFDLPWKVPVRSKHKLEWKTVEEIIDTCSRIVVVPFGVAWDSAWPLKVPAVGFPNVLNALVAKPRLKTQRPNEEWHKGPLVNVPGVCTGILYPPTADCSDLPMLEADATYGPHGLARLKTASFPHYLDEFDLSFHGSLGLWAEKKTIRPSYDRQENPWDTGKLEIDFASESAAFEPTGAGKRASSMLREMPSIDYPAEFADVIVDEGDDWE